MPVFELKDDISGKIYEVNAPDREHALLGFQSNRQGGVSSDIQKTASGDVPVSGELKYRSTVLPLGKTQEGKIVPAIPGAITETAAAVRDFMNAGSAGPPGSREVTEAAIPGATSAAAAMLPGSPVAEGTALKAGASELIKLAKPAIETTQALKTAAQSSYKVAEDAGVKLKPDAFREMVSSIIPDVKKAGFDKDIEPKAAAALKRLQSEIESGSSPTLSELDILRQVAGGAAKSADANERRIARIITGKMDDFINGATEKEFSGDGKAAVSALKDARQLWARHSKSDQIDQMFEKATNNTGNYSASGFENAIRNQFRALANNPNRLRKFSADEQEAIKEVVRGGKLQNAMTKLGKFSPTSGFFGGVLSGAIGVEAFNDPRLLAIPAIASVAKYAATKMREGAANRVSETVRGGKPAAEFFKKRSALRGDVVTDAARAAQRPALIGGASALSPDQNP